MKIAEMSIPLFVMYGILYIDPHNKYFINRPLRGFENYPFDSIHIIERDTVVFKLFRNKNESIINIGQSKT
jgi:hypothetical protein